MSVEAEMSVLGCMMLDDEFCREAIDSLTEEMFFPPEDSEDIRRRCDRLLARAKNRRYIPDRPSAGGKRHASETGRICTYHKAWPRIHTDRPQRLAKTHYQRGHEPDSYGSRI